MLHGERAGSQVCYTHGGMTLTRERLVALHGRDSIAVSTLQPGLESFASPSGFLAYRHARGYDVVLGPPMCAPGHREELLAGFLARSRRPFFSYLDEDTAVLLRRLRPGRLFFSGIGVERVLPLDGPRLPLGREVQSALRKATRAGLHLEPVDFASLAPERRAHLEAINEGFVRRSQVGRELGFINRPMSFAPDAPGRLFLLRRGAEPPFGFAVLDPYLGPDGRCAYLLNGVRFEPTRLWGVYLATVALFLELLRAEGAAELSLGMCPMFRVHTPPALRNSVLLDWQMRLLVRRRSHFYDLDPLERMKELLPGRELQRFIALPTRFVPGPLHALMEVSGMTWSGMVESQKVRVRAGKPEAA